MMPADAVPLTVARTASRKNDAEDQRRRSTQRRLEPISRERTNMSTNFPIQAGASEPIVYIVDDDPRICRSLSMLLNSVGIRVEYFNCIGDFIEVDKPDTPSCLILDVRLKGESGLA